MRIVYKKIKKGFTLIELLAVIVILGIILVIAIPNVSNIIIKAKSDAYDKSKDLIVDSARNYVLLHGDNLTWNGNTATIYLSDLQNENMIDSTLKDPRGGEFNNTNNGTKVIVTKNGNEYTYEIIAYGGPHTTPPVITLIGSNPATAFQGYAYNDPGAIAIDGTDGDISEDIIKTGSVDTANLGTYTLTYNVADSASNNAITVTRTVNVVTHTDYVLSEGVNKPKIITGMTPVKWNGSIWVNTTEADAAWYNYTTSDKQWANARTIDGSMWVWIPRYAYQIASGYHTNTAGTINIKFAKEATNVLSDSAEALNTPTYSGNSQTNYIIHPAFTFGGTELTGIWVAKFKATISNPGDACYTNSNPTNCDKSTLVVRIIDNAAIWRNVRVGTSFTAIRNMEINNTYGWGTTGNGLDTHLIKSSEWGAATYLSQSTYGTNSKIWFNNSQTYITGCVGTSATTTTFFSGCQNAYSTVNGVNGGTTGNVYGIFDMNGPVYEYTAAYVNNGAATLNAYGSSIVSANAKYKDIYTVTTDSDINNYKNASTKYGDAIYETSSAVGPSSSWYGESSYMPYSTAPWVTRSGDYGTVAGSFYFGYCMGDTYNNVGFRPVLTIATGL